MKDLVFIAGNFLFGDIPSDKEFLCHYFTSDLEKLFLSYYLALESLYQQEGFLRFYESFCDHTGFSCSRRWIRKLLKKYKTIEETMNNAYLKSDLSMISKIKVGALFNSRRYHQL
jgi:hypothetical protein